MTKISKFAAASVAALTLVAGVAATSTQAQAGYKHGWGIAAGVAAGALIAGAAASHGYGYGYGYGPGYYVAGPGYASCKFVPRYDYWGNYAGSKKVCYY